METIRFSKIGVDDLSLGSGSFEVRLADERIVAKEQINVKRLAPDLPAGRVLFISSENLGDTTAFVYDEANEVLSVPAIDGGSASGGHLTIDSTSHATKGDVLLQPSGGHVGIGVAASPDSELHVAGTGQVVLTIENDSGVTTGDPFILFSLAGVSQYTIGVDDSDSDKLKISTGGTVGATPVLTVTAAGFVGVGATAPDSLLHVQTADSTAATPDSAADELVLENTASAGMTIATGAAGTATINFADPDSASVGAITYFHASDVLTLTSGGTDRLYIDGPKFLMNDNADTNNTSGLTISQLAADDNILGFKSSDIAHGLTSVVETDTYGYYRKYNSTQGGVLSVGISTAVIGNTIRGIGKTEDTSKAAGSVAFTNLEGYTDSGTNVTAPGANANILVVKSGATTVFIVDTEGDLHVNGSGTLATFDDYDDVALLSAVKAAICTDSKARFGQFLTHEHNALVAHGVLSQDGFLSYKGLSGLLIDALRQIDGRIRALEA